MGGFINEIISLQDLSPELIDKISSLVTLLQAIGVVFIVYVVYILVKTILGYNQNKRIIRIEKMVKEIDKKLSSALRKRKKK